MPRRPSSGHGATAGAPPAVARSLLASELPFLRPDLRILAIDPADLDAVVTTLHPAVVICSHAFETIRNPAVSILILSTDETDTFVQPMHGAAQAVVNPRLSDLLRAINASVPAAQSPAECLDKNSQPAESPDA